MIRFFRHIRKQTFMKKIVFGLALVFLTSCGNKNKESESTTFILDFSDQKTYIYKYSETTSFEDQLNNDEPSFKSMSESNGNLNLRIKENNLADLSLTILKTNLKLFDQNGVVKDTISNDSIAMVLQNMDQKGTFENNSHDIMFDLIFSLPRKDLKIGETDKIPMQIPFDVDGSKLFVRGFSEIEYSGTEIIDGMECALLKGKIDISEIEIPEEMESTHEITATGKGTYYYNVEDQYVVGVEISIDMTRSMNLKNPKNNKGFVRSKGSSEIIIRLQEIEE